MRLSFVFSTTAPTLGARYMTTPPAFPPSPPLDMLRPARLQDCPALIPRFSLASTNPSRHASRSFGHQRSNVLDARHDTSLPVASSCARKANLANCWGRSFFIALVQPPIIGSGTNHPVCAGKGCFAHLIDGAATPPLPRRGVRLLLIGPVSSR